MEIIQIVDLMLNRVDTQLRNKDMGLELTPAAKQLLATRGYDPVLGARPLRRTIQREIEDALSERILYGTLSAGEIVVGDVEPDPEMPGQERFTFRGEPKPVGGVPDSPPVDARPASQSTSAAPRTAGDPSRVARRSRARVPGECCDRQATRSRAVCGH